MVLDHVANGAGGVVEEAAALDAEVLAHGDLDAFDVVAVPERLIEEVGEAEVHHVAHRIFGQVVIDAEDG